MLGAHRTLLAVALLAWAGPCLAISNAVVQWQDAAEQTVRVYNISNQLSAKYYALVNVAQYQALLATPEAGSSAAAAFAAHYVLSYFFPFRSCVPPCLLNPLSHALQGCSA